MKIVSVLLVAVGLCLQGCTYNVYKYNTEPVDGAVCPASNQPVGVETVTVAPVQVSASQFHLVTKYKKIHNILSPQELTYVEFTDGRTYIGDKEPDVSLQPGEHWFRPEVAARDPAFPGDETKAIWVKVWAIERQSR